MYSPSVRVAASAKRRPLAQGKVHWPVAGLQTEPGAMKGQTPPTAWPVSSRVVSASSIRGRPPSSALHFWLSSRASPRAISSIGVSPILKASVFAIRPGSTPSTSAVAGGLIDKTSSPTTRFAFLNTFTFDVGLTVRAADGLYIAALGQNLSYPNNGLLPTMVGGGIGYGRGDTRAMDAACRYDDRRFAVLLSGVGLATAHARMEGLRRQCATQIVVLDGQELGFTVSMGVASFPHTAHSQDELVSSCDSALAEAKRRGGNHVTLASIRFERN